MLGPPCGSHRMPSLVPWLITGMNGKWEVKLRRHPRFCYVSGAPCKHQLILFFTQAACREILDAGPALLGGWAFHSSNFEIKDLQVEPLPCVSEATLDGDLNLTIDPHSGVQLQQLITECSVNAPLACQPPCARNRSRYPPVPVAAAGIPRGSKVKST